MWGIEEKDLKPIHCVAKQFDPAYNPEKLGAWGILFLCCGAMAGQNSLWHDRVNNSDIFVRPSDLDKILQGKDVCTSDDYAVKFSEFIKKWSNDSLAISVIEKRLENSRGKISDKVFLYRKVYLTLAFMLNSLQELSREELLGFDCQTWLRMSNAVEQHYGWPELFFAAGLLLNNEDSVGWDKMASVIRGMGKSINIDVTELFSHYAGKNLFSESGRTKIWIDQLRKGARVRMRNGLEAIVVKECDGNILIAKVFGDFTETGSVYAHDILATMVNGKWIEVGMTEDQARFCEEVRPFLGMSETLQRPRKASEKKPLESISGELFSSMPKAEREYGVTQRPEGVTSNQLGSANIFFTEDKANKAREILRKELGGIRK